ncbi:MAG: hypothetical protein OXB86_00505 [Bdellovibrionales bacterium]|nr:hypothetical protein [Bdellovibrionales bacterium]
MFKFYGFQDEKIYDSLHKLKGSKREFGFDADATVSRSVAKRRAELLDPLSFSP